MNNIMTGNSTAMVVSSINMVIDNIACFAEAFRGNIRGIKVDVSIMDNAKTWHTLSQRVFRNGSVHTAVH